MHDALHTKVIPSAECYTDHRLFTYKLTLQFKPELKKKRNSVKKLNVSSLCLGDVKANFQTEIQQRLIRSLFNDDPTPETLWNKLMSATLRASADVLGNTDMNNREWLDECDKQIHDLLTQKRSDNQGHLAQTICTMRKATFRSACSTLQRNLKET